MDRQGVFRLFDGAIGVKLRVERAESSEPLLEATAEWERGEFIGPLFIWKAGGLLHMIYECSRANATAYATSTDGYKWTRPEMGQVEFDGSSANNLLRNGIRGATGVFIDPQAPAAERFKAMGATWPGTTRRRCSPWKARRPCGVGTGRPTRRATRDPGPRSGGAPWAGSRRTAGTGSRWRRPWACDPSTAASPPTTTRPTASTSPTSRSWATRPS